MSYAVVGELSPEVAGRLIAAADAIDRAWWCEPLMLWRDGAFLKGDTKLFRPIDEGDDDDFMAFYDARFIAQTLADWSRNHDVAWELDMAGEPMGMIMAGTWDEELVEFFDEWAEEWSGSADELEAKARRILSEHPWD